MRQLLIIEIFYGKGVKKLLTDDRASIKNEPPEALPEGLYNFEIVDIDELIDVETAYGVRDFLRVYCIVLDDAQRGKLITRRISRAYTAGFEGGSSSHLYDLACAVTKEILEDVEPFNINDLVGGFFKGKVSHKTDSKGRIWANIVKVKDAGADAKKLDDGEKQFAKDLIEGIEERRLEREKVNPPAAPKAPEPEDKSVPSGGEDVEPEEVKVPA